MARRIPKPDQKVIGPRNGNRVGVPSGVAELVAVVERAAGVLGAEKTQAVITEVMMRQARSVAASSPRPAGAASVPGLVQLAVGNSFVAEAVDGPVRVIAGGSPGRRRPLPSAVEDAPGWDQRPDPARAGSAAELVVALQEFREWAGEVPFAVMADRSGQLVSKSTLQRALTGRALPSQQTVIAVIAGCGGREEDTRAFVSAWRRIKKSPHAGVAGRHIGALRALPRSTAR
jgi:hypothetical protein